MKYIIKEFPIDFSKQKNSNVKNQIKYIERKIRGIKQGLFNAIHNTNKTQVEKELDKIYKKSKGAYIRSKTNWIKQGEKCTSYFLKF